MCDLICENERLRNQFHQTGEADTLERYVVSELQPPIGDYENALSIIYHADKSAIRNRLWIIGGYIECVRAGARGKTVPKGFKPVDRDLKRAGKGDCVLLKCADD